MKSLLIISAGIEAVPGIQLAKHMGINVVVSDGNRNAPGFPLADDAFVASTYDISATVAAAAQYHNEVRPLDGVMCIASDVPLTVASVAAALNLPGISIESARLAIDKLAMKQKFEADGVLIPWFSPVESESHLRELVASQGFPLVIKPVDSRGSRGVLRLTNSVDLDWAYATAKQHSPTGRVMIERFMFGPQVSTESLLVDGVAYTPGFSDRNYEYLERYSPHIIENGGQLPSLLDKITQQSVRELVQQAAVSMGIRNGVVKGDIVVTNGKPYVIELAARLSGGYFCTHEIPLNTGVDLVGAAIRQALGERIVAEELQPKFNRPVAQRYLFPDPGKVVYIEVPEWIFDDPNVSFFELRIAVGDVVPPPINHPARSGVVITTGDTVAAAVCKAEEVISSIKVVTHKS
jgi:biotin carboxylase